MSEPTAEPTAEPVAEPVDVNELPEPVELSDGSTLHVEKDYKQYSYADNPSDRKETVTPFVLCRTYADGTRALAEIDSVADAKSVIDLLGTLDKLGA